MLHYIHKTLEEDQAKEIKIKIKIISPFLTMSMAERLCASVKDNAILGSANFTSSGFKSNIELSLLLSGEKEIIGEPDGLKEKYGVMSYTS